MQYIKDVFQTLRRYQGGCFEWSGKHAQWECFGPTANPQLEIVVRRTLKKKIPKHGADIKRSKALLLHCSNLNVPVLNRQLV